MIRDHELAAASPPPGVGPQVPADFIDDDGLPVKGLGGVLTVLHDGRLRRPRDHRLALPGRRPSGPADRRTAREPRRRGQAPRPGDGAVGNTVKWNRTTVKAVGIAFVTIIATSFFIMWTLDHDGETITLGGDDPTRQRHRRPGARHPRWRAGHRPRQRLPWVLEEELPVEGQGTLALIDQGGPFPFPDKDGSTFGTSRGCCPTTPAATTPSTPSSRRARRIAARAGSSPETAASSTGPRTIRSFERIARRAGISGLAAPVLARRHHPGVFLWHAAFEADEVRPHRRARRVALRLRRRLGPPRRRHEFHAAHRRHARLPRLLRGQPRRPVGLSHRPERPGRPAVGRLGAPGPGRARDRFHACSGWGCTTAASRARRSPCCSAARGPTSTWRRWTARPVWLDLSLTRRQRSDRRDG